jgi:hypothetical protein
MLDMGFEIRAHGMRGPGLACVAYGRQRLAHAHALGIALGQRMLQREGAREHARAHHHGDEARAFFIGPHGHLQRSARAQAGIGQRAQHLQPGQHAVVAVELAARGLGVDVAARHHGRQVVVQACAARKDVADGIDTDAAAGLARPLHEEIAPLAVPVRQRQAAHAALGRGAYARQVHQRLPQAGAVDAQLGRDGGGCKGGTEIHE